MLKTSLLQILLINFIALASFAESLTLDSRYFSNSYQEYDLRGLPQFGFEIASLKGIGLEASTQFLAPDESHWFRRSLLFFSLEFIAGNIVDYSFLKSLHETAHGARWASMGWGYKMNGKHFNFFSFYFNEFGINGAFAEPTRMLYEPANMSKYYDSNSSSFTSYADFLVTAAGVNAEMSYASHVQDMVDAGKARISHFSGYWLGKLSTAGYPSDESGSGDIDTITQRYGEMGLTELSRGDYDTANYISLFGSATTWKFFSSIGNYVLTGQTKIQGRSSKLRMPDIDNFLTSRGLSYRVTSGYRFSEDFDLLIRIEHVTKGKRATEYNLSLQYQSHDAFSGTYTVTSIFGLAPGYGFKYNASLSERINLYAGLNYDSLKSLDGERNIHSLNDGNTATSVYAGTAWNF